MADRMHPYSMFPQNITSNSLQQSQIPQQPPQSQQSDPQMISALSNPEHSRMWQQMNQLQNSYRPQQSGDLATSQMNHQASISPCLFFLPACLVWENSVNEMCMSYPCVMMVYGQSPFPQLLRIYNILSLGAALDTIFTPAQVYVSATDFPIITFILTFSLFRCRNSLEGRLSLILKVNPLFDRSNNPLGSTRNV